MEYRIEFKLAINNHEAEYFKMAHLRPEELERAQERIFGILDEYLPQQEDEAPNSIARMGVTALQQAVNEATQHSARCQPCQPTQPECGACGEERVAEATAELDRQMDKVAELAKKTPAPAPSSTMSPLVAGTKGLLYLHCASCDASFVDFLKYPAETYHCKCGAEIDLYPCKLARFEYDCPDCGRHSYGYTNDETAGFEINCVCGKKITLEWRNKTKSYTRKGE